MGPNRNEWQKRCTFNGFCKKVLKNEAIDAIRENRTRSRREVTFSDLSPQEENQLYTCDQYFVNDEAEKSFFVAGREITAKQLADALHSLPEEKRQAVLLYYFFDGPRKRPVSGASESETAKTGGSFVEKYNAHCFLFYSKCPLSCPSESAILSIQRVAMSRKSS